MQKAMKLFYSFTNVLRVMFLGLLLGGCSGETAEDCSLVLCAGNESVYLEIILEGNNVLSAPDYLPSEISITANGAQSLPEIQLLTELIGASEALLELHNYDWAAGATYSYFLELGNDYRIPLSISFARSGTGCCGGSLRISELNSPNFTVEKQPGGFYRLVLG
jgi:hypothetical protein